MNKQVIKALALVLGGADNPRCSRDAHYPRGGNPAAEPIISAARPTEGAENTIEASRLTRAARRCSRGSVRTGFAFTGWVCRRA